jgi:uncharacterized protein YecE (DUF72 family)
MTSQAHIRVGIGGWNYEPWRETFYPSTVTKKAELEYASRKVTAIEINSTFYRLQKAEVFAKWRDATPDGFMFSVKAPRFVAQRRVLADAGPSIERFLDSGVTALGEKLGPLLWQLDPKHAFQSDDMQRFLDLLPEKAHGLHLRHALEVRHESFSTEDFLTLARERGVTVVLEDDAEYPGFADATGEFIYARLRRSVSSEPSGYTPAAIKQWATRAQIWAKGSEPTDLPRVSPVASSKKKQPRDVFIYFINGAKERAPAAAMKLLETLG